MKIVVENISDKPIFLGVNPSPIMLFVIQDGKWAQIRNEVTYISSQGGEGFVLHPKAEDPNTWIPAVHPSFGSVGDIGNERVILRILAVGEFMANGQRTGIRVGAYADSFIRQP